MMSAGKKDPGKTEKGKTVLKNVRCRACRVVDGYSGDENKCRFCGEKLFKGDAI